MMMFRTDSRILVLSFVILSGQAVLLSERIAADETRTVDRPGLCAGASAIDVSSRSFPVLINGGFLQNSTTKVNAPLFAKCLVLDNGTTRLAIVIVDSFMMPRELLDRAKEMAREKTGIATDRMLIAATHTYSAPAALGALGCPADPACVALLPDRIAEVIAQAAANLAPARLGWATIDDDKHTFCRRWIRRPDGMLDDAFGNRTVRANMHPGHVIPDAISPSGPVDPALIVLSVQTAEGRPIAVLTNYSQHYFGSPPVSSDYFGKFAAALARRIGALRESPPFVGTSFRVIGHILIACSRRASGRWSPRCCVRNEWHQQGSEALLRSQGDELPATSNSISPSRTTTRSSVACVKSSHRRPGGSIQRSQLNPFLAQSAATCCRSMLAIVKCVSRSSSNQVPLPEVSMNSSTGLFISRDTH